MQEIERSNNQHYNRNDNQKGTANFGKANLSLIKEEQYTGKKAKGKGKNNSERNGHDVRLPDLGRSAYLQHPSEGMFLKSKHGTRKIKSIRAN